MRSYKRPSDKLLEDLSKALQPPPPSNSSYFRNISVPGNTNSTNARNEESQIDIPSTNTIIHELKIEVPDIINKVIIVKNGKKLFIMEIKTF